MEPETLRNYVAENRELEEKLTKRNQQYIYDLKKSLDAANLSEEEKTTVLHDMLPILVTEQKGGKTARQLFGTVSERTEAILTKPAEVKASQPVLMWLDNSLLLLGLLAIMVGFMGLIAQGQAQMYGLTTLILGSAYGGWVFYLMYKLIYQYEQPGADQSQRPKIWKSLLLLVPAFFGWILVLGVTSAFPANINPVFNPLVVVLIGAAAIALRMYLKKKYNIIGSLSAPRR
ncbi:MAG: DUF1129 domain-containing protein [Enterococcus sp.]